MGRKLAIAIAAALLLLALSLPAERWIEGRLEERFGSALAESDHATGSIGRVEVCLPCLSYTIHEVDLYTRKDGKAPLLRASAVDVGFAFTALPRCAACGEIVLRDAVLHVDIGREDRGQDSALDVEWESLGRGLLPVPIDRIAAEDALLFVRYDRYREPIEWRFEIADALARSLSLRDRGVPPRVAVRGRTPGGGRFEVRLDVKPAELERSLLVGIVEGAPLTAFDSYIQQRLGLDVEGGALSATMRLEAMPGGWFGHLDCQIADLDLFAASDLWQNPYQALKDGLAGAISDARNEGDRIDFRVEIDRRGAASNQSLWSTLGEVVRWIVLTPFTAPFHVLKGEG